MYHPDLERSGTMTFNDAIKEFALDCKIRHLSPKTIDNYRKQLRYLERFLVSEFSMQEIRAFMESQ